MDNNCESLIIFIKNYLSNKEKTVKQGGIEFASVEEYGRNNLFLTLFEGGIFKKETLRLSIDKLRAELSIIPVYEKLFDAFLDILQRSSYLLISGEDIIIKQESFQRAEDFKNKKELIKTQITNKNQDMSRHIALINLVSSKLIEILSGKIKAVDVIFPAFSMENVEFIFKNNKMADYFNEAILFTINKIISDEPQNHQIKILEIGAGTGGTSEILLDKISMSEKSTEYYYTDISKGFVRYGQKKYGNGRDFVKFKVLDISNPPEKQGFETGYFDIILASNVIHATSSIIPSLNNIYKLLNTNGILLLNELTTLQDFATLTFGLLDGWWLAEDTDIRIKHSPLLSKKGWLDALSKTGFKYGSIITSSDADIKDSFDQSLICGFRT